MNQTSLKHQVGDIFMNGYNLPNSGAYKIEAENDGAYVVRTGTVESRQEQGGKATPDVKWDQTTEIMSAQKLDREVDGWWSMHTQYPAEPFAELDLPA